MTRVGIAQTLLLKSIIQIGLLHVILAVRKEARWACCWWKACRALMGTIQKVIPTFRGNQQFSESLKKTLTPIIQPSSLLLPKQLSVWMVLGAAETLISIQSSEFHQKTNCATPDHLNDLVILCSTSSNSHKDDALGCREFWWHRCSQLLNGFKKKK